MLNQATLQSDQIQTLKNIENTQFQPSRCGVKNEIITLLWQDIVEEEQDEDIYAEKVTLPKCMRLDLDELNYFEIIDNQFKQHGLIFHNSLAIHPSNPAFPSQSGLKVLMGSPKSGFLEVNFLHPVHLVSALVTSSQRLVLEAYDQNDQLLTQSVLPTANLSNSGSEISPNTMLSVIATDIKKVKFCSFDGNFTLDEFRFCFST
ncbi:hypothetical protein VB713_14855 [Anabaena cylindrica UHCC 0172]|uniref:hypothetical protein n=1 Tax=Anabaena cylindrica TaxID=1165 RepID=UPI002B2012D0|nr:hypothetical protein [Anabaena cylindrica]MEA5552222.1 hypothetical protein [Anabaena cylindrica UHCC 0172]